MATVADLTAQLGTALGTLSPAFVVLTSGSLDSQRVEHSQYRAAVRMNGAETTQLGSNLSIEIVAIECDLLHRAAGSTATQIAAAEDALALILPSVANETFWMGLAAVRSSPVEVEVKSDLERVGEVVRYTILARCALEA